MVSLSILLVLAVGVVGAVWGVQHWLTSRVETIDDPFTAITNRPAAAVEDANGDTAMNILILGSDSRISAGDPSQWEAGAQRTDTIMLVHLPADRADATVMSIPRDSWVTIPGHGEAKINAAFSYGGSSLLIETVEQLTDVRIDHFVVADFESFKDITDSIGGVRITLTESLTVNGTTIEAGQHQLLDGEQALAWVRERKTLARGDFDRVQRQQAWIRAIIAKLRNDGTLSNPARSLSFLQSLGDAVATDEGLDSSVMSDIQSRVQDLGSNDFTFMTVPTNGTGRSADGQSIVVLNDAELAALMAAVNEDSVAEYLAASSDAVDLLPPVVE